MGLADRADSPAGQGADRKRIRGVRDWLQVKRVRAAGIVVMNAAFHREGVVARLGQCERLHVGVYILGHDDVAKGSDESNVGLISETGAWSAIKKHSLAC